MPRPRIGISRLRDDKRGQTDIDELVVDVVPGHADDLSHSDVLVRGHEAVWTNRFIDQFEFVKGAVTPDAVRVYASYLRDPDRKSVV